MKQARQSESESLFGEIIFLAVGGAPLKLAKNIFSSIITKLSGPVGIGLIRMYTKFEGEKLIRS